jgi:hypothetical protein
LGKDVVTVKRSARTTEQIQNILDQYSLSLPERLAIHALMATTTRTEALKVLAGHGFDIDKSTLSRWLKRPEFQAAVHRAEALIAKMITKVNVLRKTEVLLEEAMLPRPILHKGEDTGFTEVDLGVATRLVELQGKAVGLFEDDTALKLAVLVDVDFSGRKDGPPVIDVKAEPIDVLKHQHMSEDDWLG